MNIIRGIHDKIDTQQKNEKRNFSERDKRERANFKLHKERL